jgi:dTDP-L-rhamnose 4-epimerase
VHCPVCDVPTTPAPTPEEAPTGGETVYAITKVDQERLTLAWGRQTGIPTVALRYSCTYGPRQSIFNPYTGVIAIFSTRILNGQPPILYEDGEQTRDMCFVEDVARANLLAATTSALDGRAVNVGSGRPTTVREMARLIGEALGTPIEPVARGEFRPGEMRHLTSDIRLARTAGYAPSVTLADGIARYVAWIRSQGDVRDYFATAEAGLRERRIVHRLTESVGAGR